MSQWIREGTVIDTGDQLQIVVIGLPAKLIDGKPVCPNAAEAEVLAERIMVMRELADHCTEFQEELAAQEFSVLANIVRRLRT